MKNSYLLATALMGVGLFLGCNQKKSDVDLFDEGPTVISVSASNQRGYEPLYVDFSAYLETEERTIREEISEVKWIVTGTNNFRQEFIIDAYNYQDEDWNKEDFFYWDHTFDIPGSYRVVLELNGGQYRSNAVRIFVRDHPDRP